MNKLLKSNGAADTNNKLKNEEKIKFLQNNAKKLVVSNHHYSTPSSSSSTSSMSGVFTNANGTRKIITSSSSSTSSINSTNTFSNENFHMPINPFEETNKFRLEQSVLSPNLFHVANTSTPERDTNSLWNIDQRAVLYPADIPTDESSLKAQYNYDHKLYMQVSAAVENFWTQNKIIIESPMASSAGSSAFRPKFPGKNSYTNSGHKSSSKPSSSLGVNSPLSYDIKNLNQIYQMSRLQSSSSRGSGSGSGSTGGVNYNNGNDVMSSSRKTHKRDQSNSNLITFSNLKYNRFVIEKIDFFF